MLTRNPANRRLIDGLRLQDAKSQGRKDWQQRIEHYFDYRTKLLWSERDKQWYVWYDAPSGAYIVFGIPQRTQEPCTYAVYELMRRQKNRKRLLAEMQESIERQQREKDAEVDDLNRELAECVEGYHAGRVSVGVPG